MCRHNQAIGCALMSFGLGVLIGSLLTSGFFSFVIGIGSLILGFLLLQKK